MNNTNYRALVLNADYTPINAFPLYTWGFERTLRNVIKESVVVLEEYKAVLRSPTFEYHPPSVIALKKYVNKPRMVPFNRVNIFTRDNFCCQYCGKQFPTNELTFDHVIPKSKGGKTNFSNIVSACIHCNTKKSDKEDMFPINKPVTPTMSQLATLKLDKKVLHESWYDYLYWAGILEQS